MACPIMITSYNQMILFHIYHNKYFVMTSCPGILVSCLVRFEALTKVCALFYSKQTGVFGVNSVWIACASLK